MTVVLYANLSVKNLLVWAYKLNPVIALISKKSITHLPHSNTLIIKHNKPRSDRHKNSNDSEEMNRGLTKKNRVPDICNVQRTVCAMYDIYTYRIVEYNK